MEKVGIWVTMLQAVSIKHKPEMEVIEHSNFNEVGRTDLIRVCVYIYNLISVATFGDNSMFDKTAD